MNSDLKRREELDALLGLIWTLSENVPTAELARRADLSVTTIDRLYYGTWIWPRFETIQKLSSAVGLDLGFTNGEVVINSVRDWA